MHILDVYVGDVKRKIQAISSYTGQDSIVSTVNGKIDSSLLPETLNTTSSVLTDYIQTIQENISSLQNTVNILEARIAALELKLSALDSDNDGKADYAEDITDNAIIDLGEVT